MSEITYKKLYPSASQPGLYFGLGKIHKLEEGNRNVEDLPLRPVISNIGTATYQISKYLANLLAPLAKSIYTIESTKDFLDKLKQKSIHPDYLMVSFDVVSLFTNVPLDYTIDLILKQVYEEKLIETKFKKMQLRELLNMCTKEMHFAFNEEMYKQIDGVAMGSPLGPVIANIFMVHLETHLIPQMGDKVASWGRYVDDTFTFVKANCIDDIIRELNGFHRDIQFTYEVEKERSITFLDVLIRRKTDGFFETTVFRKKSATNLYVNWKAFAPRGWKIGTLKGIIRRAFLICSEEEGLAKELRHIKHVFVDINGYPKRIVNNNIKQIKRKLEIEAQNVEVPNGNTLVSDGEVSFPYMCLPYKGREGENILKRFQNKIKNFLPNSVKPRISFKGKKLGSHFRIKDKVKEEHQSDLIYKYYDQFDLGNQELKYVGETKVRYGTRTYQHLNTDKKSAVYKYIKRYKLDSTDENFGIIEKGFDKPIDRKLAEALYIKELKPVLNEQVQSFQLHLFN